MKPRHPIRRFVLLFLAVLLAASSLTACSLGAPAAKTLTGADKGAVLAYSETIADNLLAGYNSADYATFSKDFDDVMMKGIPEQKFKDSLLPTISGKIGKYVSRTVESVTQSSSFVTVVYNAKFENDEPVVVRLSLSTNIPHQVTGLWFDSAKLRQK
jgi:hypothetical protein